MSAPLFSPEELDAIVADAERIDMTLAEYIDHLKETCVGHAATLIIHPEHRPPSLAFERVQTRLVMIALLEVIDALRTGEDPTELLQMLDAKAEVHIALTLGEHP